MGTFLPLSNSMHACMLLITITVKLWHPRDQDSPKRAGLQLGERRLSILAIINDSILFAVLKRRTPFSGRLVCRSVWLHP